jgi:hypothetical protein
MQVITGERESPLVVEAELAAGRPVVRAEVDIGIAVHRLDTLVGVLTTLCIFATEKDHEPYLQEQSGNRPPNDSYVGNDLLVAQRLPSFPMKG